MSSVLYLLGQKDLCSIMASIWKVSFTTGISLAYIVLELFYINLYFKFFSTTMGDSACEALRNFEGVAFWIPMFLLLEERMSVPCQ